jgi:serine/threonine protein kinase/Tol biopolymer transport system component
MDEKRRREIEEAFTATGSLLPSTGNNSTGQDWARLGQTFGRFVVASPLGRGGMGEVYRARDSELNRTVALKFLSSGDLGSPESVARFLREAQAASALNHPGIVTVYDVVRDGTAVGIVMELIEGISLRYLCGKPQPAVQVADWGRQIAMALAAAHAAGIVHRDIKPENLMLRPDGFVKVLDFGIARHIEGSFLNSSTGRVTGTLRYMSPEQVRGEPARPASDIFTLGIVLYELATGVHPFGSEAPMRGAPQESDALLAPYLITTREPRPATEIEPSIPTELNALLMAMLRKDPSARPTAESVADQLLAMPASAAVPITNWWRGRVPSMPRIAIASVMLTTILGGAIFWANRGKPPDRAAPVIVEGFPLTGAPGNETNPAFSLDGRQIAYAWDGGESRGEQSIYVRLVDGGNPLRLTSGAQDDSPVWSPDASRIAFLRYSPAAVQVLVIPALGGAHTLVGTITDDRLMRRKLLAWSPDADVLVVADSTGGPTEGSRRSLFALRISSGERRQLTSPPVGVDDVEPVFSPDGRKLAFLRKHGALYQFHVIDTLGGPSRQLGDAENVEGLTWSADLRSLTFCTNASPPRRVQVLPAAGGNPVPAPFQLGSGVRDLVISPKDGRMAFVHEQKDRNIWALTQTGGVFRPLIASTRSDEDPRISPDGRKIAFTSNRGGAYELWVCERDGSNPHPVTSQRTFLGSPAWSPDGRTLAYDAAIGGPAAIWLVNAEGGPSRRLLNPPSPGFVPNWSADGAWMYYAARQQIWKTRVAGGQPLQVTRHGGFEGFETFDGKYFYFVKDLASPGIWRVPVAGGEEELLPELASVHPFRSWDVGREGIYYVESKPKPVLKLFRFRDRKTLVVADVPQPPQRSERGLSVSADGSLILYLQVDSVRNEILVAQRP